MRIIKDVERIGVFLDNIRIISKHEEPVVLPRDRYELVAYNTEQVKDQYVAREHGTTIEFEKGAICRISEDRIQCGKNLR